jgi:hypothetical protein
MKRAIAVWAALGVLAFGVAGCGASGGEASKSQADKAGDPSQAWAAPPSILSASPEGGGLVIRGAAPAGGRVVLRASAGAGFAATANDAGRFEIRMPRPGGDMIFSPELQLGQDVAEAPESLVVLAGGQGAVALLRSGAPARRLDGAGPLEAIDSDGRALVAGGRAPAGAQVSIQVDGRPLTATADQAGRWTAMLGPASGPVTITIDGRPYLYPGPGGDSATLAERAGAGWRVHWAAGGAGQTTWLPDRS